MNDSEVLVFKDEDMKQMMTDQQDSVIIIIIKFFNVA